MIELVDEFKEGQGAYNPPLQRGATEGAAAPTADAVGAVSPIEKLLFPEARRIFSGIYGHFLASAGSSSKIVLVCSASSGEGATTVAAGLAIAAAEKRASQVLLIDGNCHTPKASEAFGLADRKGLSDVLGGSLEASLCVSRTNISNLSLIGVGITPGNHIQALEAPKFRALLDKLAGAFQFVLVDGPPINAYPESLLYASQVDRVLLVIHAGVSRGPVVAKALSTLSAAGCDKIEVVLNRRTFAIPQRLYRKL
jgi:capsular exopolysaccharide synthesis family protein